MQKLKNKKVVITIVILIAGIIAIFCYYNLQANKTPVEPQKPLRYQELINTPEYKEIKKYIAIPPKYDDARDFHEGLATVKLNNKWGFIDKTGKTIIKPQFTRANDFKENLAATKKNGKYGFVDKTGKMIISTQFDEIQSFSEGLAAVKLNNQWGFIDKTGDLVIKPVYKDIHSFSEGLAGVKTNNKWGYLNKIGKSVIPPQYTEISLFCSGLAAVNKGTISEPLWGFIDKTGKYIIAPNFINAYYFNDGLFAVESKNSLWGVINKEGNYVIKTKYFFLSPYKEGLAYVCGPEYFGNYKINPREITGFIDISEKLIIKVNCNSSYYEFSEGLAAINNKQNKWGYINKKGKWFIKPVFEDAKSFNEGLAAVKLNGKWGYIKNSLNKGK